MFLYVTIFVLTALVCVSDSLFQSLLFELIGELLTTILIPYNILQGENSLSHYMVFFNRNIFRIYYTQAALYRLIPPSALCLLSRA